MKSITQNFEILRDRLNPFLSYQKGWEDIKRKYMREQTVLMKISTEFSLKYKHFKELKPRREYIYKHINY